MSMRLSLLIDGSSKEAIVAVKELGNELEKTGLKSKTSADTIKKSMGDAAKNVEGAAKLSAQHLTNMQYQFQDIAVGLSSGQSPFTVMIQQGSQLVQAFKAGTGPLEAIKSLGGGIAAFLTNPLNLSVVAIGLAASAVQMLFSAISSGADKAETALKNHEDLIKRIGTAWSDASRKAVKYSLDTDAVLLRQAKRDAETIGEQFGAAFSVAMQKAMVGAGKAVGFVDAIGGVKVNDIGGAGNADLSNAATEFVKAARTGTPDVKAFINEISKISNASDSTKVHQMVDAIVRNLEEAGNLQLKLLQTQDTIKGFNGDTRAMNDALGKGSSAVKGFTSDLAKLGNLGIGAAFNNGMNAGGLTKESATFSGVGSVNGLGSTPQQFKQMILDAAKLFGLDADMLARQIRQESGFRPNEISPKGAMGLMQLMPGTAKELGAQNPFDPKQNIFAGANQMSNLLRMYSGNQELALMGYNWGQGNVKKWQASGSDPARVPKETRDYVNNILDGGSVVKAGKAIDKSDDKISEKKLAQQERWNELIGKNNSLIAVSAMNIGKDTFAAARNKAEIDLMIQAKSIYGDRLDKEPALYARVTEQVRKLAAEQAKLRAEEAGHAIAVELQTKKAADNYRDQITLLDEQRGLIRGFVSDFSDAEVAGKGFLEGLKSSSDNLLNSFMKLGETKFLDLLLGKQGTGDTGFLGNIFSTIFGGGSGGSIFANGAAFAGGSPISAFAKGDIFHSPTFFPMSGGKTGLLGEAGPEAIMPLDRAMRIGVATPSGETTLPLTRLASGKLGVRANHAFADGGVFGDDGSGGGYGGSGNGVNVNFNVKNFSSEKFTAGKATRGRDGSINIEAQVGAIVNKGFAEGKFNRALQSQFTGMKRQTESYG